MAVKNTETKKVVAKKAATSKRITFKYYAPEAGEVCLAGDFNGWGSKKKILKKNAKGEWTGICMLKAGSFQYKYIVDSSWVVDSSVEVVDNGMGGHNNIITV